MKARFERAFAFAFGLNPKQMAIQPAVEVKPGVAF